MAKKISAKDIFTNEDLFVNIRKSANETIESLEKIDAQFKATAKTIKSTIGQTKFESTKSIKEFISSTERANKLAQESAKLETLRQKAIEQSRKAEEQLEKIKQQKIKTEQQEIRLARQKQQELEREAKARDRATKKMQDEANAYKVLEKATRELKNQSKELGAQMLQLEMAGKSNSAQYRALAKIYDDVTKKAQQGDVQLKKLDKTVGDNFRNVGNYEGAINKLQAGLGALGIGIGVADVFRTGADAIIDFNKQIADLQAITGASGKDLEYYGQKANELGIQVEGGASAVVEAYKLIGSAKPELLSNADALNKVAESAITLSQASGMGLQESATALTDAMNQFGASADQADKFVNVLANGAKFGSAEIPQITEALLKFGAVAKSTGTSVEESTAMIELLAEKGLKGADAGTALRNVMLKLSAPDALPKEAVKRLEELGISLTELANPTLSMTEKLKMLSPLMKDTGALVKVFGTENATASLALIQNTKRIEELNKQMFTQGTHLEQANIRTNTLGHALMELKNSFLGLFTSIGSGSGSMQGFIDGIKWIGHNLGTIFTILGKVIRTWLIYKATMKAIQLQQWIANGGFKDMAQSLLRMIPTTRAYRLEQLQLARAQRTVGDSANTSASAMKTAGNTMKAIPWVLIISSLVELYNWWVNVASASAEARRQADLYKQAQEKGAQDAQKISDARRNQYEEEKRQIDLLYRTKISKATSDAERNRLSNEMQQKNIDLQKKYATTIANQVHATINLQARVLALKNEYIDARNGAKSFTGILNAVDTERARQAYLQLENIISGLNMGEPTRNLELINSWMGRTDSSVNQLKEDYKSFSDMTEESTVSLLENQQQQNDYSLHINKSAESYKGLNDQAKEFQTTLGDINDYLQESLNLMQDLEEISQDRKVLNITEQIDKTIEISTKYAEQGQLPLGVNLNEAPTNATTAEQAKIDEENLKNLVEANTKLNRLIDERYELEKANAKQRTEFAKQQIDLNNQLAKEAELNKLLEDRDRLLKQEGIDKKSKDKIEADFQVKKAQLDIENAQRDDDARLKKIALDEKLYDSEQKLDKDRVKSKEDANKKILDGWKQNLKDKADATKKADEDELEKERKKAEDKKAIADALYGYLKEMSDKRIEQLDKEIAKAQSQMDYYKKLAEEGNINAKESLAEQQRIIDEANKKKQIEQKRMAYLELAKTAYATYQDKVANKSKKPLADTIKDISLLQAFIKTIPAFEDGTENTGTNGRGIDGRGGFHAILHPKERVLTAEQNAMVGDISNMQLAKLADNYRAGKIKPVDHAGTSFDLSVLVNEIKDLKDVVKSKPETNIELGEITSSIMEVVKSTKKGNQTTYNRYKIRK